MQFAIEGHIYVKGSSVCQHPTTSIVPPYEFFSFVKECRAIAIDLSAVLLKDF